MTDQQTPGGSDGIADQAREKASEAQEKLTEGAEQARSTVAEQVGQRTDQASEQVRASTSALKSAADQLRDQGQDGPAKLVGRAAEQGDRLADYLRDTDGNRLLHDVESFGRRQPAVVIGAGLLAGLALARLLKASSEQRYRSAGSYGTGNGASSPPPNGAGLPGLPAPSSGAAPPSAPAFAPGPVPVGPPVGTGREPAVSRGA